PWYNLDCCWKDETHALVIVSTIDCPSIRTRYLYLVRWHHWSLVDHSFDYFIRDSRDLICQKSRNRSLETSSTIYESRTNANKAYCLWNLYTRWSSIFICGGVSDRYHWTVSNYAVDSSNL